MAAWLVGCDRQRLGYLGQSASHAKYARLVQAVLNPVWLIEIPLFPGHGNECEREAGIGQLPVRAKGGRFRIRDRLRGFACTACQVPRTLTSQVWIVQVFLAVDQCMRNILRQRTS